MYFGFDSQFCIQINLWLREEKLFFFSDTDNDKDGFISKKEFLGDFQDPNDEEAEEPEWVKEETQRFNEEYDKNHDGKLDKEEVNL